MMNSVEEYVNRIGSMISQRQIDLRDVHDYAETVSVMLMTLPHLFPAASNQWKETGESDPVTDTMASPDIWGDFAAFYQLAATAAKTAQDLSRANDEEQVKRLHRALGTECDLCHSLYVKE
jgi:cytochrome c556